MSRALRPFSLVLLVASLALGGGLPAADLDAVRALERRYVQGWLAGDAEAVMGLFTDDAVIIPSGTAPQRGRDAMRRFWWPDDGSTTVVESYETTLDEVHGSGAIAWAFGRGRLVFRWEKDGRSSVHTSDSVFTMIARRGADGTWRMTHRMWSTLPPPVATDEE